MDTQTPYFFNKIFNFADKLITKMAKAKSSEVSRKISFGKKGTGKHKRRFGPKEQKPKKYRGQGR